MFALRKLATRVYGADFSATGNSLHHSGLRLEPCRTAEEWVAKCGGSIAGENAGAKLGVVEPMRADAMTEPLNHHAALVYVMVAMSSVDRALTDDEFARIGEIVSKLPVFTDCDENGLLETAEACSELLSANGGLEQVLRLARDALPEKLRETAYWVALEVATADHLVRPEEIRFLDMLGNALELDRLTTAAMERGIRARNMTL